MSRPVLAPALDRHVHPRNETRQTKLNEPSKEQLAQPFYNFLPKGDPVAMLRWKIYVRKRCKEDLEFRKLIIQMCKADLCFFASTFGWVFEPRPPRHIPFTPWCDQADLISWFQEAYETHREVGCLSGDTPVLTDRGWVRILDVQLDDKVWDGEEWVFHEGVIYQGRRDTIPAYGLRLTPDHLVLSMKGWKRADQKETPIRPKQPGIQAWRLDAGESVQTVSGVGRYEGAVQPAIAPCSQLLRGAWDTGMRVVGRFRKLLGRYGCNLQAGFNSRSYRQRRELRAQQLPVGFAGTSIQQSSVLSKVRNAGGNADGFSDFENSGGKRVYYQRSNQGGLGCQRFIDSLSRLREPPRPSEEMPEDGKIPVYDLVNCGPRRRFVVRGDKEIVVKNCEKTRGIGLSWDWAIFCEWLFLFVPEVKIGMSSKDVQVLDGPDSNSLMGKVDYLHSKMPSWLRGQPRRPGDIGLMRRTYQNHLRINMETGASIQGFASTDSKLRSLRFSVFGYDEFAYFPRDAQESLNASQYTAPVRFFISTWHGTDNAFHDLMRVQDSTLLRIQTYWWNNPDRWKGCYTTENGRLKVIDKGYKYPPDYPFVLDGLLRSPWVDYELSRAGSSVQTALEELYGLQAASGRKLLRPDTIEMAAETVRPPDAIGDIDTSGREIVFRRGEGDLMTWGDVGGGEGGPFSLGCDLGKGLSATYSTIIGFSIKTGEQVLEFADNRIDPVTFASYVFHICRWLAGGEGDGHVYLTFENNGDQGTVFGRELLRLGYGNIMRRKYAGKVPRNQSDQYLGIRNKDKGLIALAELERAVRDCEAILRSETLVEELRLFDKDEDGKPKFPRGYVGHGDRALAAGFAWGQARERMVKQEKKVDDLRINAYAELEEPEEELSWEDCWSLV